MKTLSVALAAHHEQEATTLCTLWKITRRDAEVFAFTDLDKDVLYNGLVYSARAAYTPSQLESKVDLSVDNMEMQGLLDSANITVEDLEAGFWDGADFEVVEVNYRDLTMGANPLSKGWLGRVKRNAVGMYVAELRGLATKLQQNVGRVVLPSCDAILGDARCGVDMAPFTTDDVPVTSVASRISFTASSLADPQGYFDFGVITFTTGANAGVTREIKLHQTGGVIFLQDPFPFTVVVADEFTIKAGCNKLLKLADGTYGGDCAVKFNNVPRFRGFAEVPLMNSVTRGGT